MWIVKIWIHFRGFIPNALIILRSHVWGFQFLGPLEPQGVGGGGGVDFRAGRPARGRGDESLQLLPDMGRKNCGSAGQDCGGGRHCADFFLTPSPIDSIVDGVRKKSARALGLRAAGPHFFLTWAGRSAPHPQSRGRREPSRGIWAAHPPKLGKSTFDYASLLGNAKIPRKSVQKPDRPTFDYE